MGFAQAFAPLDTRTQDTKAFSCGKEPMDHFLHRFAAKHAKLGLSSTWVLPCLGEPSKKAPVAAYYTLAASTVEKDDIPFQGSLPRQNISVVLLARLAVDKNHQNQGLGGKTLVTALRKAVVLAQAGLPALGLILDVLDEEALVFYQHYEFFQPFPGNSMRLFVPMAALREL